MMKSLIRRSIPIIRSGSPQISSTAFSTFHIHFFSADQVFRVFAIVVFGVVKSFLL